MNKYPILLFCLFMLLCGNLLPAAAYTNKPRSAAVADSAYQPVSAEVKHDEKLFNRKAGPALELMAQEARRKNMKGVAVMAYIPGTITRSWLSRMQVVGAVARPGTNLLAIASSKAAEMADTFKDSGSGVRAPLKGEFGYQGGVIRKIRSGYLIAVFSGGSSADDKQLSVLGIEKLAAYFRK